MLNVTSACFFFFVFFPLFVQGFDPDGDLCAPVLIVGRAPYAHLHYAATAMFEACRTGDLR
jgi:hypothetical protein